ncbi:LAMI_0E13608g1_1 [Lachancea mirantina]|uniref:LAMI_0E13608g1_1 n=1 Tax=Lachancea mirantina TaxID=1230905 RepID=A0A1G4JRC1_9SACH|nr:LAMI_0E13608g1_1 [Lachancea mirantina]
MVDEQSHAQLKGAVITSNIEDQLSYSDANKTVGGYIEDEAPEAGEVGPEREKLPRFSSTIKVVARTDTQETLKDDKETSEAQLDDLDDFFYGDYLLGGKSVSQEKGVVEDSEIPRLDVKQVRRFKREDKPRESETGDVATNTRTTRRRRVSHASSSSQSSEISQLSSRSSSEERSAPLPLEKRPKVIAAQVPDRTDTIIISDELQTTQERPARRSVDPSAGTRTPEAEGIAAYPIKFVSQLEGSQGKAVEIKVQGGHSFSSILPTALSTLTEEYPIPPELQHIYAADRVTLFYGNGVKVLGFMKCSSFRQAENEENDNQDIEIYMVSTDKAREYERNYAVLRQQELESLSATPEVLVDFTKQRGPLRIEESDVEGSDDSLQIIEPSEDEARVLRIALMGQDNKKFYVNARERTTFAKLADYYRSANRIPSSKNLTLTFDSEKVDLNCSVDDLDLEDDDILEVVVT